MNFEAVLSGLRAAVSGLVAPAVVRSYKNPSGKNGPRVSVELAGGERHEDFPFVGNYGFASRPPKDSELMVVFPGGCRGAGVAVASQGPVAGIPSLEDGECCVFSKFGQKILLKKDGSIVMTPASGKRVRVESALDVVGDLNSTGEVSAKCVNSAAGVVNTAGYHLSTHIHPTAVPGPASTPTPGV